MMSEGATATKTSTDLRREKIKRIEPSKGGPIEYEEFEENIYYDLYMFTANLYHLPFKFHWEVSPTGNVLPQNSSLYLEYFPDTNAKAFEKIVRNYIAAQHLTSSTHYAVIITKDGVIVNDLEVIPNVHAKKEKSMYGLVLQKTTLSFSKDIPSKQILLNGSNLPDFVLGNVPFKKINLTMHNIDNTLQINLETSPKIAGRAATVVDPQNSVFQEFKHFFAYDSYWRSDDFTHYKTNRIYQFYKQVIALWCQQNNISFMENGKQVQLPSQQSRWQRMLSPELWSYWLKDKTAWLKQNTKKALLWGGGAATIGGLWWYTSQKNAPFNIPLSPINKN